MDPEGKREAGAFFSLAALSDETPHSRDHLKPGLQDPPNPSSTLLSPHLPLVVRGGGSKGENPRKASSWLCPTSRGTSGTPCRQSMGVDPPVAIRRGEGAHRKWCHELWCFPRVRLVCQGTLGVASRVPSTVLYFRMEHGTSLPSIAS